MRLCDATSGSPQYDVVRKGRGRAACRRPSDGQRSSPRRFRCCSNTARRDDSTDRRGGRDRRGHDLPRLSRHRIALSGNSRRRLRPRASRQRTRVDRRQRLVRTPTRRRRAHPAEPTDQRLAAHVDQRCAETCRARRARAQRLDRPDVAALVALLEPYRQPASSQPGCRRPVVARPDAGRHAPGA